MNLSKPGAERQHARRTTWRPLLEGPFTPKDHDRVMAHMTPANRGDRHYFYAWLKSGRILIATTNFQNGKKRCPISDAAFFREEPMPNSVAWKDVVAIGTAFDVMPEPVEPEPDLLGVVPDGALF